MMQLTSFKYAILISSFKYFYLTAPAKYFLSVALIRINIQTIIRHSPPPPSAAQPRITTYVFLFKVRKIHNALNAVDKSWKETMSNCVAQNPQNSIFGIQRCDMIGWQKVCWNLGYVRL
jgi:hypothetical protein